MRKIGFFTKLHTYAFLIVVLGTISLFIVVLPGLSTLSGLSIDSTPKNYIFASVLVMVVVVIFSITKRGKRMIRRMT